MSSISFMSLKVTLAHLSRFRYKYTGSFNYAKPINKTETKLNWIADSEVMKRTEKNLIFKSFNDFKVNCLSLFGNAANTVISKSHFNNFFYHYIDWVYKVFQFIFVSCLLFAYSGLYGSLFLFTSWLVNIMLI